MCIVEILLFSFAKRLRTSHLPINHFDSNHPEPIVIFYKCRHTGTDIVCEIYRNNSLAYDIQNLAIRHLKSIQPFQYHMETGNSFLVEIKPEGPIEATNDLSTGSSQSLSQSNSNSLISSSQKRKSTCPEFTRNLRVYFR